MGNTQQGGCHTDRALSHKAEMAFHDSKLADVEIVSGLGSMASACLLPGCLTLINLCLEHVSDSSGAWLALPALLWMDLGNWGFTSRLMNI